MSAASPTLKPARVKARRRGGGAFRLLGGHDGAEILARHARPDDVLSCFPIEGARFAHLDSQQRH